MSINVCLVPRWAGTHDDDFYPWLDEELRRHDIPFAVAPLLPSPDAPTIAATVASIEDAIAPADRARTVLIAQSVGAQASLRWLANVPAPPGIRAFLAVAGWWDLDQSWPAIQPFIDEPFDVARAKTAAGQIHVFLSDNDPYTSDHATNAAQWRAQMEASVQVLGGRAHFNEPQMPELLALLLELNAA